MCGRKKLIVAGMAATMVIVLYQGTSTTATELPAERLIEEQTKPEDSGDVILSDDVLEDTDPQSEQQMPSDAAEFIMGTDSGDVGTGGTDTITNETGNDLFSVAAGENDPPGELLVEAPLIEEPEESVEFNSTRAASLATDFGYYELGEEYNQDGKTAICVRSYWGSDTVVTVPEEIDGKVVCAVDKDAFSENTQVEEIYLPDSLYMLDTDAFYKCSNLRVIYLGSLREPLDPYHGLCWILHECPKLEKIGMSDQANFPLDYQNGGAFGNCLFYSDMLDHMKYIYIGDSMESYDWRIFGGSALESAEIGKNNPLYKCLDGLIYTADGKKLCICPTSLKQEDVVIQEGCEVISCSGFSFCKYVKSVTIPGSVLSVSAGFSEMPELKTIILKGEVPSGLEDELSAISETSRASDISIIYPHEYIDSYYTLAQKYPLINWEPDEVVALTGMDLGKDSLLLTVGETEALSVSFNPANTTERTVSWSSNNTAVAVVDTAGVVTAKAAGTAVISAAAANGQKAVCTVTVKEPHTIHRWDAGTVTLVATCEEPGVKTFTCTECGETKTEAILRTGHEVVTDVAVAATCTASGKTAGRLRAVIAACAER